jgi:hypothetical protein
VLEVREEGGDSFLRERYVSRRYERAEIGFSQSTCCQCPPYLCHSPTYWLLIVAHSPATQRSRGRGGRVGYKLWQVLWCGGFHSAVGEPNTGRGSLAYMTGYDHHRSSHLTREGTKKLQSQLILEVWGDCGRVVIRYTLCMYSGH